MITFTSCTEDPISETDNTEIPTDVDEVMFNPLLDNIENRDDTDGLELGCFSINTPFSLDVDGSIFEINTFEDLDNAFDFDANDVAPNVDFVYPISITHANGDTEELADGEALGQAFALCIPDEGWESSDSTGTDGAFPAFLITELNSCYELVYPVTLQDYDGTTYTANNEEGLIELLASENFLDFVLPISLQDEDGVYTANTADELFDLLLDCQDQTWTGGGDDEEYECPLDIGGIACYNLSFPVTFATIDGGEVVVNNAEEFSAAMISGNIANFVYPVTLVQVDTEEAVTVNSEEELNAAIDACWDGTGGGNTTGGDAIIFFIASDDFESDCYSINYPVNVISMGNEVTYASVDDVNNALQTGANLPDDLVYPVSVTLNSTGESVVINGAEDIITLLENCQ